MEDAPIPQNEGYSQPSISPKVFVLSLVAVMLFSVIVTVVVTYFVWGRHIMAIDNMVQKSTEVELSSVSPTAVQPKMSSFESEVCGLAFEYPGDWGITLEQETENACSYNVSDEQESINGVLIESLATWDTIIKEYQDNYNEDSSSSLEKITFLGEDAYHVTLTSSEDLQLKVPVEYIFFKRQNAHFRITFAQVEDEEIYQKMTEIIQSIRFTQTVDFYNEPLGSISPFDIQNVLDKSRDAKIKSDMLMLQNAVEQYYADTIRYPSTLSELEGVYLRSDVIPEEGISYTSNGKTYTLSTKLSDGSEYVLSSEEN